MALKKRRARQMKNPLSEGARVYFETGELPPVEDPAWPMLMLDGHAEEILELWRTHRDEILGDWIRRKRRGRPFGVKFDGEKPRRRGGDGAGKN